MMSLRRLRAGPDISQRSNAATECREAFGVRGACSRFGARWVARKRQQAGRSKRFARIASRAAQPVRTPLERIGALRHAVGAWFPVITFGIPPDPDISRRSKAATTVFSKEEEVEREWYTPIEITTARPVPSRGVRAVQ